jgi:hypothetical protein
MHRAWGRVTSVPIGWLKSSSHLHQPINRRHRMVESGHGLTNGRSSFGSSVLLLFTSRRSNSLLMNCMNSSFDTTPFWSLSIICSSVFTSLSAIAAVRLLTARAAVEKVPTMNDVAIKAIALAGCTFISIRTEGWSRSYLMRESYLMAQLRRRNCVIAADFRGSRSATVYSYRNLPWRLAFVRKLASRFAVLP